MQSINISLSSGIMPIVCKKELVTPIYKGEGPKDDFDNYRGITIRPIFVLMNVAVTFLYYT